MQYSVILDHEETPSYLILTHLGLNKMAKILQIIFKKKNIFLKENLVILIEISIKIQMTIIPH